MYRITFAECLNDIIMNNCDRGCKISRLTNKHYFLIVSHDRAIASELNSFDSQFSISYNTYLSEYL